MGGVFFGHRRLSCRNGGKGCVCIKTLGFPVLGLLYHFVHVQERLGQYLSGAGRGTIVMCRMRAPFLLTITALEGQVRGAYLVIPSLPRFVDNGGKRVRGVLGHISG